MGLAARAGELSFRRAPRERPLEWTERSRAPELAACFAGSGPAAVTGAIGSLASPGSRGRRFRFAAVVLRQLRHVPRRDCGPDRLPVRRKKSDNGFHSWHCTHRLVVGCSVCAMVLSGQPSGRPAFVTSTFGYDCSMRENIGPYPAQSG